MYRNTAVSLFVILSTIYAAYDAKESPDLSLSINIPALAISDILSKKTSAETRGIKATNGTANANEKEETSEGLRSLDLSKLLTSGNPVSIKTTETSTMGEKGNAEKTVKEIAIDTLGSDAKKDKQGDGQMDEKTMARLVTALKTALFKTNSSKQSVEEEKVVNPSNGLSSSEDISPKSVSESTKDSLPELKDKDKDNGSEVAAESKPAPPESSRATKQIALVPISIPTSMLAKLQSVVSGNSSANAANLSKILPGLASLLSQSSNNTAEKGTASEKSNDTDAATQSTLNETASPNSSSNEAVDHEEDASVTRKGKSTSKQSSSSKIDSKASKKDTSVLVVIPEFMHSPRDLEPKSGFFSRKVTSPSVRRSHLHNNHKHHKRRHH